MIKIIILSLKMVAFLLVMGVMFPLGLLRDILNWAVIKLRDFCIKYLVVGPKQQSE